MEHFYENIEGWFSFQSTYKFIVNAAFAETHNHFVEVGAWYGRSAAFMATEIANSGKDITFDVIDTWEGSLEHQEGQGSEDKNIVETGTIYDHFIDNMKPVEGFYNPRKMSSLEAASTYPNGSLDFIMLDASHEYDDVLADIAAWYPKLKPNGIFAGDDMTWESVIKAVYSYFNTADVFRWFPGSNDWIIFPRCGRLGNLVSERQRTTSAIGMVFHYLKQDDLETAKFIIEKLCRHGYTDYTTYSEICSICKKGRLLRRPFL